MQRTKKYLVYFGRSFCKDKVVLTLLFLILSTIGAIIAVASMSGNSSSEGDNTGGGTDNVSAVVLMFMK
jgi:hypothetical protein